MENRRLAKAGKAAAKSLSQVGTPPANSSPKECALAEEAIKHGTDHSLGQKKKKCGHSPGEWADHKGCHRSVVRLTCSMEQELVAFPSEPLIFSLVKRGQQELYNHNTDIWLLPACHMHQSSIPLSAGNNAPKKLAPPQKLDSEAVGDPSSEAALPNPPPDAAQPASGTMKLLPKGFASPPQSAAREAPPKGGKGPSPEAKAAPQGLKLPPSPFAAVAGSPPQGVRSPSRGVQSPSRGPQSPHRGMPSPTRGPQSPHRGIQSPTRAPQSPHRGLQSPTRGPQSPTREPQSPHRVVQSPQRGPRSPQGGSHRSLGSTPHPSTLMQNLPQSPPRPSSSDAAKLATDRDPLQASKGSLPTEESFQTQPASDRQNPLKRKRLVKAGEVVKKRAAEVPAAVKASTEAKPSAKSAGVGGLALVPLPPKLQEKVVTEEELMLLDEDAPYRQEPLCPASSGQFSAASSGQFRPGSSLGKAAKLLRAGQFAANQPRAVVNSPEQPFSSPTHMPYPDSTPSHTAAADANPRPQSGYGMSTSALPALPSEPNEDLPVPGHTELHPLSSEQTSAQQQQEQQQQQQQQQPWGMQADFRAQPKESTQKGWLPPPPWPQQHTLRSQGSFTGARNGPKGPPQDPRRQPKDVSLAPQGSHQQSAQGTSEQQPHDQEAIQRPSTHQSHDLQHTDHPQGQDQEQPSHQEGTSREQPQQLHSSYRHKPRPRSQTKASQSASESQSQALSFGVKCSLPVSGDPVKMRLKLSYRWGKGSHVNDSLDLQAQCWSTDIIGKIWNAAGEPLPSRPF